jgi:hypothetical protein
MLIRLLAAVLVIAGLAQPAAADSTTQTIGGPGGDEFYRRCPEGTYLRGLSGRVGALVDHVAPMCAPRDPKSTQPVLFLDPIPAANGPGGAGGQGGEGGAASTCGKYRRFVVTGLRVETISYLDHGQYRSFVSNAVVECHSTESAESADSEDGARPLRMHGGEADKAKYAWASVACPPGQWAVGIHGRAGAYVDRLGLICNARFVPGPPLVVTRPKDADAIVPPMVETGPVAGGVIQQSGQVYDQLDAGVLIEALPQAMVSPVFDNPLVNGIAVDVCLNWAQNCGQPAADAFCRSQGFAGSSNHAVTANAPPTFVIGDGVVCSEAYCTRLSSITCHR